MAGSWQSVELGSICEIYDGPHATPKKTESGPVFLGISNLERGRINLAESEHVSIADFAKWTRRVTPRPGDVVFSYETRIGEAALVPRGLKCCLGRRMGLLRPRDGKVDSRFLLYAYLSPEFQETLRVRTIHGSTVDRVPLIEMPKFPVSIPPLPEQCAIASVLGALDDKIELNRQMNETLEALAQSLFKSWFVNPAERELPDGWKQGVVGDDFNITMGQSPPGETYNESGEGLPFFQGRADFGARFPALRVYCTAPTRIANPGDTLVCVRAPVGDINMAAQRCCIGRGLAAVRHKTGSRSYTYCAMRALREDFDRFEAEGTVFGSMNKKDFHAIPHAVPPQQTVKDFERLVHPLDQRIQNNVEESSTLAAVRDALLPKLLSGELRVKSARGLEAGA